MAKIGLDKAEAIVKIAIVNETGHAGISSGDTLEECGVDDASLDGVRERIVENTLAFHFTIDPNDLNMSLGMKVYELIDQVVDNAVRI